MIRQCFRKSWMNLWRLWFLLAAMLVALPIYAADTPPAGGGSSGGGSSGGSSTGSKITTAVSGLSAQDMVNRIADQLPSLMRMVTAIGYVIGMYLILMGLLKLKEYGEQRTMMSSQHHLREPLGYLIIGALLLYLPSSVQVGMSTFWADPNPYGFLEEQDQWTSFFNNCFMIIQLFGTIAFIRGLVILSKAGHGGGQNEFAKGLTHVIGGILCINIYQLIKVILFTLGIQT